MLVATYVEPKLPLISAMAPHFHFDNQFTLLTTLFTTPSHLWSRQVPERVVNHPLSSCDFDACQIDDSSQQKQHKAASMAAGRFNSQAPYRCMC